jgi:hypothetical protein
MVPRPDRIPLRPAYDEAISSRGKSFWRGLTCAALAQLQPMGGDVDPAKISRRNFDKDVMAEYVARAAVTPLDTIAGAALAPTMTSALWSALPPFASRQLFDRSLKLDLTGGAHQTIKIPRVVTPAAPVWLAEHSPMPIVSDVFDVATLGPLKKLMLGAVVSRELENYAIESAVAIVEQATSPAFRKAMDATVFDASAGTALRPAGLRNAVVALSAATGGGAAALIADLASIAAAVGDAGLNSESLMFFAHPGQAYAARGLLTPFPFTIVGTSAIAKGTLVGIVPDAIASAVTEVAVEARDVGTLHMESATPAQLVSGGVTASPVRQLWQTETIGIKIRARLAWAAIDPAAVQVISSVSWGPQ